ncbi:MAG: nucleotide exchange factor GrpE [Candidatus Coatesbacteria bacterium]|nr:MAG: nucleotide exchange factor GrpE [Candidatus Coatesbacteria bacterium]
MADKIRVDFRDKKVEKLEVKLAELEEELAAARAEAEAARAEAEKAREEYLRKAADLDNMRKRVAREEAEIRERAAERVIKQILPALADLTRAIDETDADPAVPQHHVDAIRMLDRKVFDVLRAEGLEPIEAGPGTPFDPTVHDAVMGECTPDFEPNTIIKVLEPGYTFKGRLLVPVKVMVCLEEEPGPGD